jgi:hypothetical protein
MVPLFVMMAVSGIAQTTKTTPEGVIHLETPDKSIVNRSVTLEILQHLITDAESSTRQRAAKWKLENPGKGSIVSDRIILTDSCMGSDQYEHDQLSEGSIICLLGISVDASELPFTKVYFEGKDGKAFELPLLATMPTQMGKSLKTDGSLGTHIWAGLYWIPKVRSLEGQLLVDFQTNRTRFRPGIDFPFSKSFGKGLEDKHSKELIVNFGTMKEVIEREYPGMELTPEILNQIKQLTTP